MDYYTVQCGIWLWNHDSEFTKWQHHAMWYVALGWHAIEFARWQHPAMWHIAPGSWHWIRQVAAPYNVAGGSETAKFYPNRTTLSRKNDVMSIFKMVDLAILDFKCPIMGSLKSTCTTSYRSSIDATALNCLLFEKIAFFCILATDRQTNRWTASMH